MISRALGLFRRAGPVRTDSALAAPPPADLVALNLRARQLQARAASGSRGCIAARRELRQVRAAILRAELGQ